MKKTLLFLILIAIIGAILLVLRMDVIGASTSNSTSNVQLIARAINGEARGEAYEGQVAVGAVILNRVKDSRFPNTIARCNI